MTEKELKDEAKAPAGGYFLYGDEDYLKEHYTKQIRAAVIEDESMAAFNEIILSDGTFTAAALEEALASPPLMQEKKLVRVSLSSYTALPEKERAALIEVYETLADYPDTVVVISVSPGGFDGGTEKKPSAALKALASHLSCVELPLQTEGKLIKWLYRHLARHSLTADERALRLMISLCGRSMLRLSGEAEKLAASALARRMPAVTEALVQDTVSVTPEEDAFQLANAVMSGNKAAALESLARAKGRGESPVKLLASVSAVFCDMAAVAHLLAEGVDRREVAKVLKIHEYRAGLYAKACAGKSLESLDRAVELCAEADVKLKTSGAGYVPLERLICS